MKWDFKDRPSRPPQKKHDRTQWGAWKKAFLLTPKRIGKSVYWLCFVEFRRKGELEHYLQMDSGSDGGGTVCEEWKWIYEYRPIDAQPSNNKDTKCE